MSNCIPPDRYAAIPAVNNAIIASRRARIALSADPGNPVLIAHARITKRAELKTRYLWREDIKLERIKAKTKALRAIRYASQIARTSRTLAPAASQRSARQLKRELAHAAAMAKRAANLAR